MIPKTAAARARHSTGLSQAEFAALLGVSKRTLQQWEQGRREPSGRRPNAHQNRREAP